MISSGGVYELVSKILITNYQVGPFDTFGP